jgi:predicted AAA+ superfamily ATPase
MANMKIKRSIYKPLADDLNRPEVSIILGLRQAGKTFLLKELEGDAKARGLRTAKVMYFNAPEICHRHEA